MTPARIPNKPTTGKHFLLVKRLGCPTLIIVFLIIIIPDGDKVTLTPLPYCSLETRATVLEFKKEKKFKETITDQKYLTSLPQILKSGL